MNKKHQLLLAIILVSSVFLLSGWGFLVHRTVTQLSIYQLPKKLRPFFINNRDSIVYHATRPDIRRITDDSEGSKHYIDFEAFGDSSVYKIPHNWNDAVAKYSADTLNKYGTLPYVVTEYLHKLTNAFRSKNADSIVFYAADLSHYVADAHVPLHTSINYDGQMTNQHGIHDLWETTVPEVEINNYNLHSRHTATYLKSPEDAIWKVLAKTHALLPEMFAKETEVSKNFTDSTKYRWQLRWGKQRRFYSVAFAKQYAAALKSSINDQLMASANCLSDFWYTAWVNAGKPNLNTILTKPYDKSKFKTEHRAYRNNELIKKRMLISLQKKSEE